MRRHEREISSTLQALNLWKSYNGKAVVKDLSFDLSPGEILGILGPNGAGKTTTVAMLYGFVRPDRGVIKIGGMNVQHQGRQVRSRLGIVQQENNLDREFTVRENLIYFAHHYRQTGKNAEVRAAAIIEELGLDRYAEYTPEQLSGGLQRRVVLGRAMINNPVMLFLDEPTTGLDPEARQEFWRVISQLRENQRALLLTTHYMDEAERLCDRLLLLQDGEIVREGTPAELIEDIVGREVGEIDGLKEEILINILSRSQAWYRPFGRGFLFADPRREGIWQELEAEQPQRLTKRRANLEDVFLKLTGVGLE